jgi:hypothetical protein
MDGRTEIRVVNHARGHARDKDVQLIGDLRVSDSTWKAEQKTCMLMPKRLAMLMLVSTDIIIPKRLAFY